VLTISAMGSTAHGTPREEPVIEPRIVVVGFASAQILDITGPLEVFSSASRFLPIPPYTTEIVSAVGGSVLSSSGLEFGSTPIDEVVGDIGTLVVSGGRDMEAAAADTKLVDNIRRLSGRSRRTTAVCSGAFLLAAAGLLDGRRATTHWAECAQLAQQYPEVDVQPDAIYVKDGDVWTSAGVTAGIDLALALVAEDHGRQAAATVARRLVMYLRRSGGQSQYSALLAAQSANEEPIRDLLQWLPDHLTEDLSIPVLSARTHLSERQFSRLFKSEVGSTPADHVEAVRVESACRLLETTTGSIEQIARSCGFGAPETMNRAFRRRLNTTPTDHRLHFGPA
jgi:transcriptional regulator GlxA family with amidase domain